MDFKKELEEITTKINLKISDYLPKEEGFQKVLLASCNYSVLNGGKRLRPIFMASTYLMCCRLILAKQQGLTIEDEEKVFPFMAGLEMIHSSSLVHDDLPCMDNDTLRRGRASTWAKYGEDMGVLAGDGLMIYAFETASKSKADPLLKARSIEILAQKTGIFGMIGGQSVDVILTGKRPTREEFEFIYAEKTAALIEAAFMIGAVLAGAGENVVKKLEQAAHSVGMAFQIEDDILDLTGAESLLGKPVGSDKDKGKVTWPDYYGLEVSRRDVASFTEKALDIIASLGHDDFLESLIRYLVDRKS